MHIEKNNLIVVDANNVKYLKDIKINPLPIFSLETRLFLSELSKALFNTEEIRKYEDLASFAFWCRKSNLERISAEYQSFKYQIGRGLALHISPSNVPVNFAFSFAFGLLSGCSNIVRIPSKEYPQVGIINSNIFNLFKNSEFTRIKNMNRFITYEKDQLVNDYLSKLVNARLIWGGDETIKEIKKSPTKPRCIDICFSDRYSFSIINAASFIMKTITEKKKIVRNFIMILFLIIRTHVLRLI